MKEFGQEIRRLREEKGITQQDIAAKFYVTAATVSRWESGDRYPDLMTAKKLADFYGVSLDSILDEKAFAEHVRKAPVMETDRSGNIQTCLYTAAAIAFLIRLIGCFLFPEVHDGSTAARINEMLELFIGGGGLIALTTGVFLSFREELSPKMAGLIGIAFFAIQTGNAFMKDAHVFNGLILALVPLLCIILLVRFFLQEKNDCFVWLQILLLLYLASSVIACFLQAGSYAYTSTSFVTRYRFLWSFSGPMGVSCLMVLLAWQSWNVYRKRKIAERGKTT